MPDGIGRNLEITRRNLPHWQRGGACYFITWRVLDGITLTMPERMVALNAARKFHGIRYYTAAAVVMPDHAHLLMSPLEKEPKVWWDLSELLKGINGASARQINKQRARSGSLWLEESFDRIMRTGEFEDKHKYIRRNPYRAGLVKPTEHYPALWISCFEDGWMPKWMAAPWQGDTDPRADRNVRATDSKGDDGQED